MRFEDLVIPVGLSDEQDKAVLHLFFDIYMLFNADLGKALFALQLVFNQYEADFRPCSEIFDKYY